jgi:hypothetical protein
MKRWPSLLLASVLTGALVVVFCPHVPDPAEGITPPETEALAEGFPETVVLRVAAKRQIAREVAAGRRSLVEAAALFGALNRLPPETARLSLSDAYPSPLSAPAQTEDERLCRQVIEWVDYMLRTESDERAAAGVARLNEEFQENLRRHGTVRLPDPSALPPAQEILAWVRGALTEAERRALVPPRRGVRSRE